MKLTEGFCIH